MAIKVNFLAIAVSLIFFVIIANAYSEEETNSSQGIKNLENHVNETLDLGSNDEIDEDTKADSEQGNVGNIQNNENKGKAVTASFGVYLEIVE